VKGFSNGDSNYVEIAVPKNGILGVSLSPLRYFFGCKYEETSNRLRLEGEETSKNVLKKSTSTLVLRLQSFYYHYKDFFKWSEMKI